MKVIVTAGPTREFLDPVRFLSNPSTGKMGFAIARAAAEKGCEVVLVTGPVTLRTPRKVRRVDVVSARDMLAAVENELNAEGEKVLISSAAIADWRPAECSTRKLKKASMDGVLKLVRNPDILSTVHARYPQVRIVGFAAETNDVEAEAAGKCRRKGMEFIVANDVTDKGCGFGTNTNRVAFIYADGRIEHLPMLSKLAVARRIIGEIIK